MKDFFNVIPEEIRKKAEIKDIGKPLSEIDLDMLSNKIFNNNKVYKNFIGAGVYDHYIPAACEYLLSRSEFVTPYTPYQAEVSQGILQALFEYQSVVCELTGLAVSNASLYDGGSALSEAILLLFRKYYPNNRIIIKKEINPFFLNVARTYTQSRQIEWIIVESDDELSNESLKDDTLCIIVQQPDFLGRVCDLDILLKIQNEKNDIKIIYIFEPLSSVILKKPSDYGADIAICEGLGCGIPLSYGGPGLGIFACKIDYLRELPGRLVGLTKDANDNRAFTLTLQTREQHIKREKATSNICTNQALNAIGFLMYITYLGKTGLKELAVTNFKRAHYLYGLLKTINKIKLYHDKFFNEFVITFDCKRDLDKVITKMKNEGISPGFMLDGYKDSLLVAVTEKITEEDCRKYHRILKETL
ncbi:MAG: aminomethyl-transferring glycine dehydrogenase subunit GcvPA [Candidatus Hydrogenedentota bacterium]